MYYIARPLSVNKLIFFEKYFCLWELKNCSNFEPRLMHKLE